jgi:L-fuconolactonase
MIARIDAHQHYWDIDQVFPVDSLPWFLGAVSYGWKQAGLDQLNHSRLPDDLEPQAAAAGVRHTVLVNAIHSLGETEWMLKLAQARPSIAGVVGWINLAQPTERVRLDLARFLDHSKLVGIRHLAQFEPEESWLLRPDVLAGLSVLQAAKVPYDLLLKPSQLELVPNLAEQLPDLDLVIDHLAKPNIRDDARQPWATHLRSAAQNPRVWCKLSGMITEADHQRWQPSDLTFYIETALNAFGIERVMFGSDWPVCTLAGSYQQVCDALAQSLTEIMGQLDETAERLIFHDNAARFYRLSLS